jgi:uncharacterized protein YwgA
MSAKVERKRDIDKVADIVRDAGGEVVGRTRLQKVAYLLELAGQGEGFVFKYRPFGPYCEELALASRHATLCAVIQEVERRLPWGGICSTYSAALHHNGEDRTPRHELASRAARADAVVLELLATAAFLSMQGEVDAWRETERRNPDKATEDRLSRAKLLYAELREIPMPSPLPAIG